MRFEAAPASESTLIVKATQHDESIVIDWATGERSTVPAIWLRDSCPCAQCLHPRSAQRLLDTVTIPRDLSPDSVTISAGGTVEIIWHPDGHVSTFNPAWLYSHVLPPSSEPATLWDSSMMRHIPGTEYPAMCANREQLRDWLARVDTFGFALLHGVPNESGSVLRVVDLFGYVRETNYGHVFDVRSQVDPDNLANSDLALGPHTDNPYRDPTPTLQLLHCLDSSTRGGDTTLVDGFRVAEDLRRSEPRLFELLAQHPLRYRFRDDSTDLQAAFPVISRDESGTIKAVHFNSRSRLPVALPEHLIKPFYVAYQTFAQMLVSATYQITIRLEPGDLVVMDNLRVLHGRTGFSKAGDRFLQGCYADRDGLRSRLAVLSRDMDSSLSGSLGL